MNTDRDASAVASQALVPDPFGGPGGWSEGLRMLGLADVGIEMDEWACRTRRAAGHLTILADVSQYPPSVFAGARGLVMSPPCQDFSMAGKRAGRAGDKGQLMDTVPEWVAAIRPDWLACEQVPAALPIWREFAHLLGSWGYCTWVGLLNAADYGVPQDRRRAFLLAARWPVGPPPRTHARRPQETLFEPVKPWVTLAEALEKWDGWVIDRRTNSKDGRGGMVPTVTVPTNRPSPTLTGKAMGQWRIHPAGEPDHFEKLTVRDALTIQSFRPDYPVQGTKCVAGEQIGNAVPPVMAVHVLSAVTGRAIDEEVRRAA